MEGRQIYNLDFLENFNGSINPRAILLKDLAKSIETHVSQKIYTYETDNEALPTFQIQVGNQNIPHLMGLSKNHHYGLPTYRPLEVFLGLKRDWSLEKIMEGDQRWFPEAQDKLIGCLFLYQIFNIINCEVYTTFFKRSHIPDRLIRDNVYFVVFKTTDGKSYSVELAPMDTENPANTIYYPRSLKINDQNGIAGVKLNITNIEVTDVSEQPPKVRYVRWN